MLIFVVTADKSFFILTVSSLHTPPSELKIVIFIHQVVLKLGCALCLRIIDTVDFFIQAFVLSSSPPLTVVAVSVTLLLFGSLDLP